MPIKLLEIAAGYDIVECVVHFAQRHTSWLIVLSGNGRINHVTIRPQLRVFLPIVTVPGVDHSITYEGDFEILSIKATFFPPFASLSSIRDCFKISFSSVRGSRISGGSVAGSLIASGTVILVADIFQSPIYDRVPNDRVGELTGLCDNPSTFVLNP
ncbi:AT-hook motif nuclear-localized protein 28-like [Tasmannia lanceolata]|uniref:AT-hook motif nuclear-localized protein 28-like n=1 Tax=Tasmannia lanceolata TaxID=3420 RepID=UPI0040634A06